MNERIPSLRQVDIFDQLTDAQLEMVAGLCQERRYARDEAIVEEGTHSTDLYVILQGEVQVLISPELVAREGGPRPETAISTLRRGQSFGEIALVDEGLRSATVRSAGHGTRLLVIPHDRLITLCETYPQLGYRLMFNLAADLAMKIRNADLRIRATLLYAGRN